MVPRFIDKKDIIVSLKCGSLLVKMWGIMYRQFRKITRIIGKKLDIKYLNGIQISQLKNNY